ncbi:hypothetical protein P3F01_01605 [Clostridium perfringens]|uniref:hypothetical protein n=1 Tax=Clostridium perfringens TaxID=1502 RepID=UPI0028E0E599|nr:hypothetical protein [Clostridium perfringens]MDT9335064.1 hypothetical protein [Clostridium perfringens]MDT9342824.1 hypothetical protein [Clostridium perfringens]MDT9346004.1 hypothetical protein [Clostridium perfringens]MDT9351908.1 hypothetical protein [Clostridium perfringens]
MVKRLEIKINEEPKVVEAQFPYNTEFDNYNIEIKKPKLVNHYILFDYTVSTKENSPIEMEDFYITGSPSFPDIAYFISSQNVLTKVENNKMRIVDAGIIVARKDYDKYVNNFDFLVNAREKGSSKDPFKEKRVDTTIKMEGVVYPDKENYKELKKTFKLDDINFEVLSIGNFDFGTFIPIFVGNISNEKSKEIENKYALRIEGENINAIYDLEKWVGFYEQVIKRYSNIDQRYNANSQYDQFYMGKIFYNPKEVNKDNVKIYLINKETNEEVRIN